MSYVQDEANGARCERHDARTSSETFLTGNQLPIGDLDLGLQNALLICIGAFQRSSQVRFVHESL